MGKQLEKPRKHILFFVVFIIPPPLLFSPLLSSPIRFCLFFLPQSGSYTSPRQSSRKTYSRAQTHTHTNKFPCEGGMKLKTYCTLVWGVGVAGLIKQLQCWNLKCCIYTRACDHTSMWEKKVCSHTRLRFPTTDCDSLSTLFSDM